MSRYSMGLLMGVVLAGCSSEASDPDYFSNPPDAATDSSDKDVVIEDVGKETRPEDGFAEAKVDGSEGDGAVQDVQDVQDVQVEEPCPSGVTCVTDFPFTEKRDTSKEPSGVFNTYSCAPNTKEGGSEVVYRVTVPSDAFLSAAVYENDGVDVDVHILSSLDAAACVDRGDLHARADVTAGDWWVVIDTFSGDGAPKSGGFRVDIGLVQPSKGPCNMETGTMPRVGDNGNHLVMPAQGPVVMEAHLVTQGEPPPYPATSTQKLAEHYALSQSHTGFVMHRREVWAPLEGGSFYGCGIGSPTDFPVEHEAWYVNMYWTSSARPAKGTKMILRKPGEKRAVVVAAGYETGPGNLSNIGGAAEESHFYLGTSHQGVLTLGIAKDQSLPYGPRTCE